MFRTIVVGTDFSEGAELALDAAITIANLALARITLVHVCALPAEHADPGTFVSSDEDDERLRACAEELARTSARRARCGVEISSVLRSGKPWEKLNNVATEVGAGMIVIGRHGAGAGARPGVGSVAEQLVRTASRPIVIVPGAPSAAQEIS